MIAAIARLVFWPSTGSSHAPTLKKRDLLRALAAGTAFAVVLTAGFTAMAAWQCGGVCLPELVDNAMLSFAAGIFGLGPVAAYGGRR
jgi:hypothetical protein